MNDMIVSQALKDQTIALPNMCWLEANATTYQLRERPTRMLSLSAKLKMEEYLNPEMQRHISFLLDIWRYFFISILNHVAIIRNNRFE